jgi:hypothetical protein
MDVLPSRTSTSEDYLGAAVKGPSHLERSAGEAMCNLSSDAIFYLVVSVVGESSRFVLVPAGQVCKILSIEAEGCLPSSR